MRKDRRFVRMVVVALLPVLLCGAHKVKPRNPVEAVQAQTEIPETELLDVGIRVFDPGIPEDLDEVMLEEQGIFTDVRKSEARFIPYQLKSTLEATGHWGAVRVVPSIEEIVDVMVTGEILSSHGRVLELNVQVHDSVGKVWFDRQYKGLANSAAYMETGLEIEDPFQDLYNLIANHMLEERMDLDSDDFQDIRAVAQLRFASDLAPYAYEDYLEVKKKKKKKRKKNDRYTVERLPAAGDPMIDRINRIRERDYMLVDTLNEHYESFYVAMSEPYGKWRSESYDVEVVLARMRKQARIKQIVGGLLIIGGLLMDPGSAIERAARDAAVVGGAVAIQAGVSQQQDSKMHRAEMRELVASFDAEVAPLLVEVEGQTLKLTGSAEAQYTKWREMLREIFETETGLPLEADASAGTDSETAGH